MKVNSAEVFTTEVDGQTVILDTRSSLYLTTNQVGTFIFALLSADLTEAELVDRIVSEYQVAPELAATDCRAFLEQLREHRLVQE